MKKLVPKKMKERLADNERNRITAENAHCKYAIRGSNGTYPLLLMFLLRMFYFL